MIEKKNKLSIVYFDFCAMLKSKKVYNQKLNPKMRLFLIFKKC
jgi:hypothetical protein